MPLIYKPDPYDGFSDDKERGRSLRSRERWRAVTAIAICMVLGLAGAHEHLGVALTWLLKTLP